MGFYNLSKEDRIKRVEKISNDIFSDIKNGACENILKYFSDEDTYIRKSAYIAIGRIYFANRTLQNKIIKILDELLLAEDFKIRQTVINAAGEIGIRIFEPVEHFFDKGIFDTHHSPRNAVIGSLKKMSEKNPVPILKWAKKYLHHPDKEIRREVCHGIELRGRKYPQDILPLLKELENDKTARVRNTLIHVLGQIAYKEGCLSTVIAELNTWTNKDLTDKAVEEIIDVHDRYKDFSILTQEQAMAYIEKHYRTLERG
ncbi:MAG TPA: HEAT repeat domain-containing protein [Bacteroidia bacterium]|jgi:HEAT repeat protein|nr:HEAT repeat domain-containing protein [Bacteroidia bacterium]